MKSQNRAKTTAAAIAVTGLLLSVAPARADLLFNLEMSVPGQPIVFIQNSKTPLTESQSGTNTSGGGSAYGTATNGVLGARAEVTDTLVHSGGIGSSVDVKWSDDYMINFSPTNPSRAILQFSYSLTGGINPTIPAPGAALPTVRATLGAGDFTAMSDQFSTLSGAGTTTVAIQVDTGVLEDVFVSNELSIQITREEPGTTSADFSTTLDITAIKLFDLKGNFLQDVTLTDAAGNTLPIESPSPAAVPEPSSLALLLSTGILLYMRPALRRFCKDRRVVG